MRLAVPMAVLLMRAPAVAAERGSIVGFVYDETATPVAEVRVVVACWPGGR
jgi:hypothetical protein